MKIKFEPRDLWIGVFWDCCGRTTTLETDSSTLSGFRLPRPMFSNHLYHFSKHSTQQEARKLVKYATENLSTKMVQYRLAATMTQEDLSRLTGLHVTAISHFESGIRRPSLKNLILLATKMKVTIDWLLT